MREFLIKNCTGVFVYIPGEFGSAFARLFLLIPLFLVTFLTGNTMLLVVPGILWCLEIVLLIFLKRIEKTNYRDLCNRGLQPCFFMVYAWVVGWASLSYAVSGIRFWISLFIGNVFFVLIILWTYWNVKRKIKKNWYKRLTVESSIVGVAGSIGGGTALAARSILKDVKMSNEMAFLCIGVLLWVLAFCFIACIPNLMCAYYFSKESEEEQKKIMRAAMVEYLENKDIKKMYSKMIERAQEETTEEEE